MIAPFTNAPVQLSDADGAQIERTRTLIATAPAREIAESLLAVAWEWQPRALARLQDALDRRRGGIAKRVRERVAPAFRASLTARAEWSSAATDAFLSHLISSADCFAIGQALGPSAAEDDLAAAMTHPCPPLLDGLARSAPSSLLATPAGLEMAARVGYDVLRGRDDLPAPLLAQAYWLAWAACGGDVPSEVTLPPERAPEHRYLASSWLPADARRRSTWDEQRWTPLIEIFARWLAVDHAAARRATDLAADAVYEAPPLAGAAAAVLVASPQPLTRSAWRVAATERALHRSLAERATHTPAPWVIGDLLTADREGHPEVTYAHLACLRRLRAGDATPEDVLDALLLWGRGEIDGRVDSQEGTLATRQAALEGPVGTVDTWRLLAREDRDEFVAGVVVPPAALHDPVVRPWLVSVAETCWGLSYQLLPGSTEAEARAVLSRPHEGAMRHFAAAVMPSWRAWLAAAEDAAPDSSAMSRGETPEGGADQTHAARFPDGEAVRAACRRVMWGDAAPKAGLAQPPQTSLLAAYRADPRRYLPWRYAVESVLCPHRWASTLDPTGARADEREAGVPDAVRDAVLPSAAWLEQVRAVPAAGPVPDEVWKFAHVHVADSEVQQALLAMGDGPGWDLLALDVTSRQAPAYRSHLTTSSRLTVLGALLLDAVGKEFEALAARLADRCPQAFAWWIQRLGVPHEQVCDAADARRILGSGADMYPGILALLLTSRGCGSPGGKNIPPEIWAIQAFRNGPAFGPGRPASADPLLRVQVRTYDFPCRQWLRDTWRFHSIAFHDEVFLTTDDLRAAREAVRYAIRAGAAFDSVAAAQNGAAVLGLDLPVPVVIPTMTEDQSRRGVAPDTAVQVVGTMGTTQYLMVTALPTALEQARVAAQATARIPHWVLSG